MPSDQLHIRVSEEQRERWETFVESDPRADSLADLVRTSVENTIVEAQSSSNQNGVAEERIDDLTRQNKRIYEEVNKTYDKLSTVENETVDADEMEKIVEYTVERVFEEMFATQLKQALTAPGMLLDDSEGDEEDE